MYFRSIKKCANPIPAAQTPTEQGKPTFLDKVMSHFVPWKHKSVAEMGSATFSEGETMSLQSATNVSVHDVFTQSAVVTPNFGLTAILLYQGRHLAVHYTPLAICGIPWLQTAEDRSTAVKTVRQALEDLSMTVDPDPYYRHLKKMIHAIPVAWVRQRGGNHTGSASDIARHLACQGSERVVVVSLDGFDSNSEISVISTEDASFEPEASISEVVTEETMSLVTFDNVEFSHNRLVPSNDPVRK
jgi:hypothetical protein